MISTDSTAQILREWFGIREAPASVLAVLFQANGETVTHETFALRLGSSPAATRNSVCRLMEAMDPGSCAAVRGEGYRLTPIGLEDCRAALADAEQRRAA